jgi:N-acetylglucosaminyldiphosphoundecaprenol N-acetyl-beta-D-mannosaminyltransferase
MRNSTLIDEPAPPVAAHSAPPCGTADAGRDGASHAARETAPACRSVSILGSRVSLPRIEDVMAIMLRWIAQPDGTCRRIVVTGFHGIWEAHKDPAFKSTLNSADLWIPDGIAPVLLARLHGKRGVTRIAGAELMKAFFEQAQGRGLRSFFYGDTEETLGALRAALEKQYPGHVVAGTLSPPFRPLTPEEDAAHVRAINDARPDILWVGLGLPRQERWIYEHAGRLRVPMAVGVGAAFGFLSGRVSRAPAWVGRCGFEWLWRLAQEPAKCWRRALLDGPRFILHAMLELTGLRKYT